MLDTCILFPVLENIYHISMISPKLLSSGIQILPLSITERSVFTGDSFALYLQVITKLSRHLPGAKIMHTVIYKVTAAYVA